MTHPAGLMLPPASIELQGLRLSYGGRAVLDGLDGQLLPGQVVGLLGRNGCGKTTLLESLLGLRELDAGAVQLFGQPLANMDDALRARIGYVPQQSDLFDWLGVGEMLSYFSSFYPRWNTARVDALLARWGIAREASIAQLSGGQQQRLAIVRALAHDPDLLVLDEPVSGLDPAARRDFLRELVGDVLDKGTTVVFSTHILSDLERVAFHVAFMRAGRITLQAPLDELLETVRLAQGPAEVMATWLPRCGAAALLREDVPTRARVRGDAPTRALVRGDVPTPPPGVQLQPVTLEDLFEGLT